MLDLATVSHEKDDITGVLPLEGNTLWESAGAGLKFQKWQKNVDHSKILIRPYTEKNIFTLDSSDWLEVPEVHIPPPCVATVGGGTKRVSKAQHDAIST